MTYRCLLFMYLTLASNQAGFNNTKRQYILHKIKSRIFINFQYIIRRINIISCVVRSLAERSLGLVTDKLTEKKKRVNLEPRSAHGRAVKNKRAEDPFCISMRRDVKKKNSLKFLHKLIRMPQLKYFILQSS